MEIKNIMNKALYTTDSYIKQEQISVLNHVKMSLATRKPVFGVSDHLIRFLKDCPVIEGSFRLKFSTEPDLFAYRRFSHDVAQSNAFEISLKNWHTKNQMLKVEEDILARNLGALYKCCHLFKILNVITRCVRKVIGHVRETQFLCSK